MALDQQVEMLVQKNEIREQLEGQKRRKIELMAEREGILGEIAPFQQKKKKQEEIIKLKIREFAFAIEELDAEIDRMQGEAEAGNEVARVRNATDPIPMSEAVNEVMLLPFSCSHKLFHPLWSLSTSWTVFAK